MRETRCEGGLALVPLTTSSLFAFFLLRLRLLRSLVRMSDDPSMLQKPRLWPKGRVLQEQIDEQTCEQHPANDWPPDGIRGDGARSLSR